MRRLAVAGMLVAVGLTAAYAQSNPIGERKDVFKSFGGALRPVGPMMRGEAPFELAKVQDALKTIADGAPKAAKLFPAGSGTGDTKALPAIWTDNARFSSCSRSSNPMPRPLPPPSRMRQASRPKCRRFSAIAAPATTHSARSKPFPARNAREQNACADFSWR